MKTKERKKKKQGISLIVLVITIIVIIILALAVILSMNKNNPIENARIAKEKNNKGAYQEELLLYMGNEYVNNHSFNQKNLNVYTKDSIGKVITIMPEEDMQKYVIAQGELVELDKNTHTYKNSKGQEVKLLDNETVLTDNAVEFAGLFENIQKEREKAGEYTLLYNGGYIANCGKDTVSSVKYKLPDGVEIRKVDGTPADANHYLAPDYQVIYKGEIVAKFILYGDVNRLDMINMADTVNIYSIIQGRSKPNDGYLTMGMFISADVNHDGVITEADAELIRKYINNSSISSDEIINQNVIPSIPKI